MNVPTIMHPSLSLRSYALRLSFKEPEGGTESVHPGALV